MAVFSPGSHASIHQLHQLSEVPSLTTLTVNDSISPEEHCVPLPGLAGACSPWVQPQTNPPIGWGWLPPSEKAASLPRP